jgi:hypothetical protein
VTPAAVGQLVRRWKSGSAIRCCTVPVAVKSVSPW